MSNNSKNASALSTSSTVRPRTKRLISGLSEGDESAPDSFDSPPRRIASPAPSPFDSRSASPIPAAHPQRTSTSRTRNDGGERYAGYSSWGRRAQVGAAGQRKGGGGSESPNSFASIWGSSWTSLQGLASDFLGNDLPNTGNGNVGARKKPAGSKLRASSANSSDWGPTSAPNAHAAIGSGTRESREAALRAQKRKDMLTRQESSYTADALGRIKRRLSDEQESRSAPPGDNDDRAALVYVHHVKKDDTLAGITIKYNCSANVVRKANRMWPNDTVQSRQTIVLPVDACGVKGKPVAAPEDPSAVDLLVQSEDTDDMTAEEILTPRPTTFQPTNGDNITSRDRTSILSTASPRTSLSITSNSIASTLDTAIKNSSAAEPPYTHDSWVLLPTSPHPTEIARLSRRALGYFPPARRKSLTSSALSSPSQSLDLGRRSSTFTNTDGAGSTTPQRPRQQRRLSNANNGYFPSYLAGPGGVGSMSKNVHFPGPAQDGLNKMFARHLPDVAPPKNQVELYQPDLPMYSDETPGGLGSGAASGAVTPSLLATHGGAGGNLGLGVNLENLGGAVEGWMRKMGKAISTLDTPAHSSAGAGAVAAGGRGRTGRSNGLGPRISVGAPGKGRGGIGDLIEMTDEFEIGWDESEDEGEERGRSKGDGFLAQPVNSRGGSGTGSGRELLGGAVATARVPSGGRKSGKED